MVGVLKERWEGITGWVRGGIWWKEKHGGGSQGEVGRHNR
jgi:hypothetical protein